MNKPRTLRSLSLRSVLPASIALALSSGTGCQKQESAEEKVVVSAVQGERAEVVPPPEQPLGAESPVEAPLPNAGTTAPEPVVAPKKEPAKQRVEGQALVPTVKRLVVTHAVENREPLPLEGAAQLGAPVTAFVEVGHAGEAPTRIVVTFEHSTGEKVGFVELDVPASSPRYRTWARTQNVRRGGDWEAVVTVKDGPELARQSFRVAAPPDQVDAS